MPLNDDPLLADEEQPRARSFTRIDRVFLFVAFALLFAAMIPVYNNVKEQRNFQQCQQNLQKTGQSILLYMQDNHGLPSAYALGENGPPGWVAALKPYLEKKTLSGKSYFTCPTSPEEENSTIHGLGTEVTLSYGFFAGLSGAEEGHIPDPGGEVMIADTMAGKFGSLDPIPLNSGAYLIGYDDSDYEPTANSKFVTRLSIKRSDPNKPWSDPLNLTSRHSTRGISALYADGHASPFTPEQMMIKRDLSGRVLPPWRSVKEDEAYSKKSK